MIEDTENEADTDKQNQSGTDKDKDKRGTEGRRQIPVLPVSVASEVCFLFTILPYEIYEHDSSKTLHKIRLPSKTQSS